MECSEVLFRLMFIQQSSTLAVCNKGKAVPLRFFFPQEKAGRMKDIDVDDIKHNYK